MVYIKRLDITIHFYPGLCLLHSCLLLLTPSVRKMMLHGRAAHQTHVTTAIDSIAHRLQVGDWTLLYTLGCNMEPLVFGELVVEIDNIFQKEKEEKEEEEKNLLEKFVTRLSNIIPT